MWGNVADPAQIAKLFEETPEWPACVRGTRTTRQPDQKDCSSRMYSELWIWSLLPNSLVWCVFMMYGTWHLEVWRFPEPWTGPEGSSVSACFSMFQQWDDDQIPVFYRSCVLQFVAESALGTVLWVKHVDSIWAFLSVPSYKIQCIYGPLEYEYSSRMLQFHAVPVSTFSSIYINQSKSKSLNLHCKHWPNNGQWSQIWIGNPTIYLDHVLVRLA